MTHHSRQPESPREPPGGAASVTRRWARVGVLFNVAPAPKSPDLERLIVETARAIPGNARLFPLVVGWLSAHGGFVAKHRLRRLAAGALPDERAVLGLLIESAIDHGAPRDLAMVTEVCSPAREPGPLFEVQRSEAALRGTAERHASARSRRWGRWAPDVEPKADAIRPSSWILEHNPGYRSRIVRKGDLRCSILEVLRRDVPGETPSAAELARLSSASRAAVRQALAALVEEGEVVVGPRAGSARDHAVRLRHAA